MTVLLARATTSPFGCGAPNMEELYEFNKDFTKETPKGGSLRK